MQKTIPNLNIDTTEFKKIEDMTIDEIRKELNIIASSKAIEDVNEQFAKLVETMQPIYKVMKTQHSNAQKFDSVFTEEMIFVAPDSFSSKSEIDRFIINFWSDEGDSYLNSISDFFNDNNAHLKQYFLSSVLSFKNKDYLSSISLIYSLIDGFINTQFAHLKPDQNDDFFYGEEAIRKVRSEFRKLYKDTKPLTYLEADLALKFLKIAYCSDSKNNFHMPRRNEIVHASYSDTVQRVHCINGFFTVFSLLKYRTYFRYPHTYHVV